MLAFCRMLVISYASFAIFACHRVGDSTFVGTWRFEDDSLIEEISLNGDHSISTRATDKEALTTPSQFEEKGTWRRQGTGIRIEPSSVFNPGNRNIRTGFVDSETNQLLVKDTDGKSRAYRRFEVFSCKDGSMPVPGEDVPRADLVGSWKFHYHLWDYQLKLLPTGEAVEEGYFLQEWHPILRGKWRIHANQLIIHLTKTNASTEGQTDRASEEHSIVTWRVVRLGKDCFAAQDEYSESYNLERLR